MRFKRKIYGDIYSEEGNIWFGFGILFIGCLVGLYGIVYAVDHILPHPLEIKDEIDYPDSFIAERAKNYLKPLADIGPKVTGSYANEVLAVNYIINVINGIKEQANSVQEIELDLQVASGNLYLSWYANLQNIIVKVHSANNTQHSVLINTHFDSVPTSPGGSDDGINVAIALEILRKISQSPTKPRNNIIFLFNGAEEVGLKASHAFITQHKWRNEVKVFVNLEATGAGGKEILFQSGPNKPWLLKYYNVPHPHGNAGGEEIFQSNVIPSDTDFRIFRDYGGVVGYDFAYTRNGYRHHTKFDGFDNINYGTYQHTGDNILQLVRNLAEAPELSASETDSGKTVFFDFIGLFYIHYSADVVALIINILTAVVSLLIVIWACISYKIGYLTALIYLSIAMVVQILGIVIACTLVLLIGLILDGTNSTMSWYKIPAIVFGLYVAPTGFSQLLSSMAIQRFMKHKKLTLRQNVFLQIHANRMLWTVVLIVGTILQLRIIYIIMIPVMFNTITMCVIDIFKIYEYHGSIWFSIYIVLSILPTMKVMYMGHEALALFIPIMGRFGNDMNPEIFIGLIVALLTIKVTSYFVPLILFIRKRWYILLIILAVFVAGFILVFTPVGFPYQFSEDQPRPQRYSIYHIQRVYSNQSGDIINDAGFYFQKYDRNNINAIQGYVTSLENAHSQSSLWDDCEKIVVCGFPSPPSLESVVWIPAADAPEFPTPLSYNCASESLSRTARRYQCSIEGSDRLGIYISTRSGVKLLSLSTVVGQPGQSFIWKNQPTYYITMTSGKVAAPLQIEFIAEKDNNFSGTTAVDLGIYATYVHEEINRLTPVYEAFLLQFPDWAAITLRGLVRFEVIELT